MAFHLRVADADIIPDGVVHSRAVLQKGILPTNDAILTQPPAYRRGKFTVIILHNSILKGRDLDQRLSQIVVVHDLRIIGLVPAGTEGHILIPDGAGIHYAVCILVEIDRGDESVTIQRQLLQQEHLD